GPLADGLAERHAWLLMVLSPLGRMAPSERRMIVDEGGVARHALTLSPDMQHELCRFTHEAIGRIRIEVEGDGVLPATSELLSQQAGSGVVC
ncbi:hypothetical protein, partial [Phreatobacter oligotrophus]|uniref:hypothetical protein n=1 Tax=Phreatobacter oligotrophus TaxID=1122261 RepID=UPI00235473A3